MADLDIIKEKLGQATTEPAPMEPPKADDRIDKIEGVVNQIGQQMETLAQATARIATNMAETPAPIAAEPVIDDSNLDPELGKIIENKIAQAAKKVERETEEKMKRQMSQKEWDDRAEKDFPELLNKNHPSFKQEFYRVAQEEFQRLSDRNAPDAVYNAASRAWARVQRQSTAQTTNSTVRTAGAQAAFVQPAGAGAPQQRTTAGTDEPLSDAQKYFANKMGVSEDYYKQHHGPARRRAEAR